MKAINDLYSEDKIIDKLIGIIDNSKNIKQGDNYPHLYMFFRRLRDKI